MEPVTRGVLPLAALFLLLGPVGLVGQSLDQVDRWVREGRVGEARAELLEWLEANPRPSRDDRQRGLWLRGVLTLDPAEAAAAYRMLVLEYPGGDFTDRALQRLGAWAELNGDILGAARSYTTLAQDYRDSPARLEAVNWLSRNEAALDSARAARRPVTPAQGVVPPRSDREPQPPPPSTRMRPQAASGDFTAQVGAFTVLERARAFAGRVRAAGFEPRVVQLPGSEFFRVRVGRFDTAGEARDFITELREAGFEAGLGTRAGEERPVG